MSNFYKIFTGCACMLAAAIMYARGEGAEITSGAFTYEVTSASEVAVTGFADPAVSITEISIPSQIEADGTTYTVTAINGQITKSGATSLTLPATITSCSDNAFSATASISRVYIASAEQWLAIDLGENQNPFTIAGSVYVDGERTTTLTLPEGTAAISKGRFKGMKCIDNVKLPESCIAIGEGAFENTAFRYFEPSSALSAIGKNAFKGASIIHLVIPSAVLTLGESAFENCTRLRTVKNGSSLVAIPESAFSGCTSLYSVELGPELAEIRANAFAGCRSLASITVPDKVTTIGAGAFRSLNSDIPAYMKRIVLGTSIQSIAEDAFSGNNPAEIIIKSETAPVIASPIVSGAVIYVPEALVDHYTADANWSTDNEIKAMTPLALTLSADGEPVNGVVSIARATQKRLTARMVGQEFEGIMADQQPIMTWKSSDENILTIDPTGNVTGKNTGTATITVSTTFDHTTYTQSCEAAVDYDKPTGVKISTPTDIMALGTTLAIKAAVEPEGALQQVVWSSASQEIATISADGVISPVRTGKATFKAVAAADENIAATVEIEVVHAKPTEVVVTVNKDILRVGDVAQLSASVNSYPHASQSVMWFTGDDKIATVSQSGQLTCVGVGNVTISALTMNDKHIVGTIDLFVDYSEPTSINLASPSLALKIGDTEKIEFTVAPQGAEQRAEWVSSDENVATVDEEGNVTAVGLGSAVITGTTGSITADCTVKVDYADPVRVYLNYSGIYLTVDESNTLTAAVLPAGARQDITWYSNDEEIATVDQDGVVTGIAVGNTQIIALSDANNEIWGGCNVMVVEATAIDGIAADAVKTETAAGTIIITGLDENAAVCVYDIAGKLVFSGKTDSSGRFETPALHRGIYIIKYGSTSRKVAL